MLPTWRDSLEQRRMREYAADISSRWSESILLGFAHRRRCWSRRHAGSESWRAVDTLMLESSRTPAQMPDQPGQSRQPKARDLIVDDAIIQLLTG
jgi:hypothetical protein